MPRVPRAPRRQAATRRPAPISKDSPLSARLAYQRALETLAHMRSSGLSLREAARRSETTPRTVLRYTGPVVEKRGERYVAKPSDRLPRWVRVHTAQGVETVVVRSSKTASLLAEHAAAVDRYLKTGLADRLRKFRGKSFRAGKVGYPLLTDRNTLERLAEAGEVAFEDLYALTA